MRFGVILADPPWAYADQEFIKGGGISTANKADYPTMQPEEMGQIPVGNVAADDCLLFCWATGPKLPEALDVMRAWGFRYVTTVFCWLKTNPCGTGIYHGMGRWTAGNAEPVLLGKRGHPARVAMDVEQVIREPVGQHSRKPLELHRRIERLMGDVPRLELFARRIVRGWCCIGNETTGNDIRQDLATLAAGREIEYRQQVETVDQIPGQGTLWDEPSGFAMTEED